MKVGESGRALPPRKPCEEDRRRREGSCLDAPLDPLPLPLLLLFVPGLFPLLELDGGVVRSNRRSVSCTSTRLTSKTRASLKVVSAQEGEDGRGGR